MKKAKFSKYKIFSFDDLEEDTLYDTHIDLISNDVNIEGFNPFVKSVMNQKYNSRWRITIKGVPREKELLEKYQYLIHLLITKSFYKGYVELPASFYQDLFGNQYNIMFRVLSHLGYLHRNGYYKKGKSSMRVTLLKSNIKCREKYVRSIEKFQQKYLAFKRTRKIERFNLMINLYGDSFIKSYSKNLSLLELVDENGARNFIDNDPTTSDFSKLKNHNTLDRYLEKKYTIGHDNNNRLYTILTNTNRNLKKYLNIRYQVDISNCHPVLFNYYIINQFNIPINMLSRIYNIDINNSIYTQYDTELFCKLLKDNKITYSDIPGLKPDHLLYIYLTSIGKFWDFIMGQKDFEGVSRDIVKETMFQEVFYSKSLRGKSMSYQKIFKKIFPSVFKLILDQRRKFREEKDIHLSNKLMKLESEIIHRVLQNLFDNGYIVLNIHDAIVVLDTMDNSKLTPEDIQEVIKLEFQKLHLLASTKTDYLKYYPNRYYPK